MSRCVPAAKPVMKTLHATILQLIEEGRAFAVATVAEAKGSVPGKQGAKMVFLPDGSQVGTVGGAGGMLGTAIRLRCRTSATWQRCDQHERSCPGDVW